MLKYLMLIADVAESADAPDSGSGGGQHLVGSSPIIRTRKSRGSFEPRLFYDNVEKITEPKL